MLKETPIFTAPFTTADGRPINLKVCQLNTASALIFRCYFDDHLYMDITRNARHQWQPLGKQTSKEAERLGEFIINGPEYEKFLHLSDRKS